MGYRSQVVIALKPEVEVPPAILAHLRQLFSHADEGPDGKLFYDKCLKWYTDDPEYFPEVKAIQDYIDELDEELYYFVRVGENTGDVDTAGSWWEVFEIDVSTRVTFKGQ